MNKLIFATILAATAMTWHIRCDHEDPDDDASAKFEDEKARSVFENRVWIAESEDSVHAFVFLTKEHMGLYAKQNPWSESRELFLWEFESANGHFLNYDIEIPNRNLDSNLKLRVWECDEKADFDLCAEFSGRDIFGTPRFYSRWDMATDSESDAKRRMAMEIAFSASTL